MLAVLAWVGAISSAAAAGSAARPTLVLHSRFTHIAGRAFVASDRYVFITTGPTTSSGRGTLIDDSTGRRQTLSFPGGCYPETIGASTLAIGCPADPTTEQLYNIPTAQTSPFSVGPTSPAEPACDVVPTDCGRIADMGTRWIAVKYPAADPHELPSFTFENRQSGQRVADPAAGSTTVDPNSSTLPQKVCSPLSLPTVHGTAAQGPGSLTAVDGFQIAAGDGGAYLERCGSHLHERLTSDLPNPSGQGGPRGCDSLACPLTANAHAIVWLSAHRISGIFLPSRHRFSIVLPPKVAIPPGGGAAPEVALTARTLYLNTGGPAGLWSVPAPTLPAACAVPKLPRDATVKQVKHLLAAHHCGVGRIGHRRDHQTRSGRVTQLVPRPGTRHPAGTRVEIIISTGR